MKLLLLTLFVACQWINIPTEKIKLMQTGAMLASERSLLIDGICGGTANFKIEFESIQYCKKQNKVRIKGQVTERLTGELYSNCKIANGEVALEKIILKSEVLEANELGEFDCLFEYQPNDGVLFFALGAQIASISIELPN